MRKYTDKRGGLEIEKYESNEIVPDTTKKSARRKSTVAKTETVEPKPITAKDIVETAESYQLPMFTHNPTVNGGSQCVFCGEKTSYDNRHVCIACWKKYKDELFDGIKQAVSDVDINIVD